MTDLEMKKMIAEELNKGTSLSDIQTILARDFDKRMTFLELRLLAAELENVDWSKQDPEVPAKDAEEDTPAAAAAETAAGPGGKTVVEKSGLVRPGALASGTVSFGSGAKAEWIVDQMGRLGLENVVGEPTEEDFAEFQQELRKLFS